MKRWKSLRLVACPALHSQLLQSHHLPHSPSLNPYSTQFLKATITLLSLPLTTNISISLGPLSASFSKPFSSLSPQKPSSSPSHPSNYAPDKEMNDPDSIVADEKMMDDPDSLEPLQSTARLDSKQLQDLQIVLDCLGDFQSDAAEAKRRLEQCGVTPTPELEAEVLARLRHDWGAAYTFFLWAGSRPGYARSLRTYHSMLSVLARARRFDTAWALVAEMRRAAPALLTPHTLLILIRRYAAVHDVARAINTFYAYRKFGFVPGIGDFQGLLGALCRYKNVEDAEHLLLCNERTYPFETKSFNIVLNGWCNILARVRDAKRFWVDMDRRKIRKDVVSYGCMISLYSKAGNLNDVLKLFNRMKEAGIELDRKVYNAVVYALAKGNCIDEAKKLVETMEEKGVAANAVTFNSLIGPLCKARKVEDARALFDEMLRRGLSPSIRTYHAFFDMLRSVDEVFELLNRMKETGCSPVMDTYIMLIRKLSRWRQHESVSRLWDEMHANGLGHDRSAYIVLIHGLFLNGRLEEASKYYEEMKMKGFEPEPKTDEMIQVWLSGRETSRCSEVVESEGNPIASRTLEKKVKGASNTSRGDRDYLKQPEIRSIRRERGYSLW